MGYNDYNSKNNDGYQKGIRGGCGYQKSQRGGYQNYKDFSGSESDAVLERQGYSVASRGGYGDRYPSDGQAGRGGYAGKRSSSSKKSYNQPKQPVNSAVQNRFLGIAMKNGYPVTIVLDDGGISGSIIAFDTYTIAVETLDGSVRLLQKHSCREFRCDDISADDLRRRVREDSADSEQHGAV